MKEPGHTSEKTKKRSQGGEIRLSGRGVSRGIAVGRAVSLFGSRRQFYKVLILPDAVEDEVARLRQAVAKASREISALAKKTRSGDAAGRAIFETHRMILSDSSLVDAIECKIRSEKVNAEWAAKAVADEKIAGYKSIEDANIREKYIDIDDVCERLLDVLAGERSRKLKLIPGSILVARELKPSTIIELATANIGGLVSENGGWTSHTFILAREHGIPAVAGVANAIRKIKPDDEVIVDGFSGTVIVAPSEKSLRSNGSAGKRSELPLKASRPGQLKTLDGRCIELQVNLDVPERYEEAFKLGARGVGLYRSEYLYNRLNRFPTEAEQIRAYKAMAKATAADGVRIRTFDLGPSDTERHIRNKEPNPALGLRGIRHALAEGKQLRTQVRALLRSNEGGNVSIVLPMITGVDEVTAVRSVIESETVRLRERSGKIVDLKVGAMVELPSAVTTIEALLRHLDFISLGTNDLVQYLLAADRDNGKVSSYFRSLHPAVISSIGRVADAAINAEKDLIVCGEMAGSPFYVPLLIGMGITKFSMNLNSLSRVERLIEGVAYDECIELVKTVRKLDSTNEVETAVREYLTAKWSHLIAADLLQGH